MQLYPFIGQYIPGVIDAIIPFIDQYIPGVIDAIIPFIGQFILESLMQLYHS